VCEISIFLPNVIPNVMRGYFQLFFKTSYLHERPLQVSYEECAVGSEILENVVSLNVMLELHAIEY
jgi:hypothetical protein